MMLCSGITTRCYTIIPWLAESGPDKFYSFCYVIDYPGVDASTEVGLYSTRYPWCFGMFHRRTADSMSSEEHSPSDHSIG